MVGLVRTRGGGFVVRGFLLCIKGFIGMERLFFFLEELDYLDYGLEILVKFFVLKC